MWFILPGTCVARRLLVRSPVPIDNRTETNRYDIAICMTWELKVAVGTRDAQRALPMTVRGTHLVPDPTSVVGPLLAPDVIGGSSLLRDDPATFGFQCGFKQNA